MKRRKKLQKSMNNLIYLKLINVFYFIIIFIFTEFILIFFIEIINFKYLISMTKNSRREIFLAFFSHTYYNFYDSYYRLKYHLNKSYKNHLKNFKAHD